MRHRYNYPEMPGAFTGCEYADIDTQLRKVAEELAEAREAFEEFAKTGDHADHVRLVEEFMDIDHAVEQGKRLLERYGASMEQAGARRVRPQPLPLPLRAGSEAAAMTRKSDWDCHDVEWHAPGLKRPIAYSTVATKEWIDMLTGCGLTVEQMHRASVIDSEAQKVLEAYIERGLGGKTGIELRFEGDAIDGRTERAVMDRIEWMPFDAL